MRSAGSPALRPAPRRPPAAMKLTVAVLTVLLASGVPCLAAPPGLDLQDPAAPTTTGTTTTVPTTASTGTTAPTDPTTAAPTGTTAPTDPTATTAAPTDIPSPPTGPTSPPDVITVQDQIYIITGIFLAFTIFLLVVALVSAYVIIGLRQKIKRLEGGGPPSPAPVRKPTRTRRPTPGPAPARENRAYAPDDDDDDVEEELRSYQQYPDRERAHSGGERQYDRFHKPMPDSYLPSEDQGRGRRDDNSRYGAGNLARLPKGPAPQPPYGQAGDGRYPDDRGRRPPSHSQW